MWADNAHLICFSPLDLKMFRRARFSILYARWAKAHNKGAQGRSQRSNRFAQGYPNVLHGLSKLDLGFFTL